MARFYLFLAVAVLGCGCSTTAPQNPSIAPQLPTPSPYGPGQMPPPGVGQPPLVQPGAPSAGIAPVVEPSSPEDARVQFTAAKLYQANPWLKIRPRWIVSPQETPGITTQGEQYAMISASLVRASSDGQLAAVMALQLGDLAALRQQFALSAEKQRRQTSPAPDYYPQRDGSTELSILNVNEAAKFRGDPRDLRKREQGESMAIVDASTHARQILAQAGYSQNELDQAAPLLQRYPMVRPSGR